MRRQHQSWRAPSLLVHMMARRSRALDAPSLRMVFALLLVRATLSQMDVPTRSSYVMAVVTEAERMAATSFISVPRSLAASRAQCSPVHFILYHGRQLR